jgi:hypothetical protein
MGAMSWLEHYKTQAEAWRREAHAWTTHGKEAHARQALDIAEVYDALAREEEESPSRLTREEVNALPDESV